MDLPILWLESGCCLVGFFHILHGLFTHTFQNATPLSEATLFNEMDYSVVSLQSPQWVSQGLLQGK